jgi:lipopolysaccharide export system ATP-binding protein
VNLLEVKDLVKTYSRRKVVDHVCFNVFSGEIVGLLGPNGAGKTTTFRMTMGMVTPDEGSVLLAGTDVTRMPMYKRARRGLGYLSQEPSIFQRLTVRQNILAILETLRLTRRQRHERCEALLAELGLSHLARHQACTLSGGERRRLEITRALITSPILIMLDEPFSGVDPKAVFDIQEIIRGLRNRGIGVLLTDHSVRETLAVTDRSYIIHEGKILRSGTGPELIADPLVRKFYLGEKFRADEITAAPTR